MLVFRRCHSTMALNSLPEEYDTEITTIGGKILKSPSLFNDFVSSFNDLQLVIAT